MSIATVVTRGYGSFGTVNLVVTRGYSPAAVVTPTPASTGGGGGSILAGRRRRSTSGIWVRLDDEDTRAALRARAAESERLRHAEAIARQREAQSRAEREATEAELAARVVRDAEAAKRRAAEERRLAAERAAEAERQRIARLRHLAAQLGGARVFALTGPAQFTTHRVVVAGLPALIAVAGGQASFATKSVVETLVARTRALEDQLKRHKGDAEALMALLLSD